MHDYKQLYLSMLHAADNAIRAMERMDFGTAKALLIQAQNSAEEQWLKDEDRKEGR